MPPSVNAAYVNAKTTGRRGRTKSPEYRQFESLANMWFMKHSILMGQARKMLESRPKNIMLKVRYVFWFRKDQVWTKKGDLKKNDTSNRIKVVEDFVANCLRIDDTYFWHGEFEKIVMTSDRGIHPFVDVYVDFVEIATC